MNVTKSERQTVCQNKASKVEHLLERCNQLSNIDITIIASTSMM